MADFVPIVKVHHVIMALGNIAKGFPDYPNPLPENYVLPPMEVFAEMAQAILVCLEAMNVFKPIRDAVSISVVKPQQGLTLLVDKVCIRQDLGYSGVYSHTLHSSIDEQSIGAF